MQAEQLTLYRASCLRACAWWLPVLLCAVLATQTAAFDHVHIEDTAPECELCLHGADQPAAIGTGPDFSNRVSAVAPTSPTVAVAIVRSALPAIRGPPHFS